MSATRRSGAETAFLIVVSLVALLLSAEAVRRTLAHRHEARDPALALWWEPSDPSARETVADRRIMAALARRSPTAIRDARTEASRVFTAAPLHWAALRDVGLAADLSGDGPRAAAVMSRAALRGHRDVAVEAWWLQRALTLGDMPGAVGRLDALLRVAPDLEPRLLPLVETLLRTSEAREAWTEALAADPPWRGPLLDDIALHNPDLDAVIRLFAALRARGSPPNDSQFGALLTRLALAGRYADARTLWTGQASGASATVPFDGDFAGRPGPAPFNWRLVQPVGGLVREGPSPGRVTALSAAYPASTALSIAEQMLTLSPGSYRLTGRWRVDQPATGAAVGWTVACANTGAPLAAWRHGTDVRSNWARIYLAVVVPLDCPAQWLRLSGRAGDGFGDVETAFTGLRVSPAVR